MKITGLIVHRLRTGTPASTDLKMMMGADEEWPAQAEALTSLTPAQLDKVG